MVKIKVYDRKAYNFESEVCYLEFQTKAEAEIEMKKFWKEISNCLGFGVISLYTVVLENTNS